MKSCLELPEGYEALFAIDLQKDKKLALLVNSLALVIALALIVLGGALMLRNSEIVIELTLVKTLALLAGLVVYILLHELVHGIFMRINSGQRPKYGFTGLYAYAGSQAYFAKKPYIVIALAPIVVWGVVLAALCVLVPRDWFWVVWLIQVINLSGAAGDLYVTVRFSHLPRNILVQDTGVSMTVFGRALEKTADID